MASLPPPSGEERHLASNTTYPVQILERGYSSSSAANSKSPYLNTNSAITDFGSPVGRPAESSPLSQAAIQQHGRFNEEWDASQKGSSVLDGPPMQRSNSGLSQGEAIVPSRAGTLKKKASLRRGNSLKRSGSRRSSRAGSVRSLALEPDGDEMHSAFYSPIPTTGNPTEILANRFSVWRKLLKDLITYFREIQSQYEQKSKNILKTSNVINNTNAPSIFLPSGGINDALQVLRDYHKQSIIESNKAKTIENDVILALTGLRSDLQQKIKEIKNLSGDFKNSVDKEMDGTRKAVQNLGEALGQVDIDPAQITGKQDPYLLRLAADRQLERQVDEENYLHQAYLNLESSGRELESIVVGEIQKAYNAYGGILKREADEAYNTVDSLRSGPISMPKDQEWNDFIVKDEHFVDPRIPVRQVDSVHYPGRNHELASEVRAGLLERKSKYLKSYTAGWYVLSPTHLHEFKSADKAQAPIMSLYLPEQKLGSHSTEGGSSNKFILKGRQTGSMHRGHSWVFRAESHDTMIAWYDDIKSLTEKSPQERSAFVRQHARSFSGSSQRAASVSSDGAMDEEDEEPFSATASAVVAQLPKQDVLTKRPQPGGRFPSDLQVNAQRGLQAPLSPSSGSSFVDNDTKDHDVVAAATRLPGSGIGQHYESRSSYGVVSPTAVGLSQMEPKHASDLNRYAQEDGLNPYTAAPVERSDIIGSQIPSAGGVVVGNAAAGAAAVEAHRNHQAENAPEVAAPVESTGGIQTISFEPAATTVKDIESGSRLAVLESAAIAAPDNDILGGSDHKENNNVTTIATENALDKNLVGTSCNSFSEPTQRRQSASKSSLDSPQPITNSADVNFREESKRPSLGDVIRAGQHHESVSSVSQLHVPGSYPHGDGSGKEPDS